MSTPTANGIVNNTNTIQRSNASPVANTQSSPQIQMSHHHKREVACVFVIDGSARMKPHYTNIYESYIEPILRYGYIYIYMRVYEIIDSIINSIALFFNTFFPLLVN